MTKLYRQIGYILIVSSVICTETLAVKRTSQIDQEISYKKSLSILPDDLLLKIVASSNNQSNAVLVNKRLSAIASKKNILQILLQSTAEIPKKAAQDFLNTLCCNLNNYYSYIDINGHRVNHLDQEEMDLVIHNILNSGVANRMLIDSIVLTTVGFTSTPP